MRALPILLLLLAAACGPVSAAPGATTPPADAKTAVEALLASMGGRDAWAAARGYRVLAQHYLADETGPVRNEIVLDFREPRLRIRSDRPDGRRVNVIDLDGIGEPAGWRLVEGKPVPMTAGERADQRQWWNANVYRTLSRLARRDPALSVALAGDGRLRVLEAGKPLLWYRLNRAGEPVAFAPGDLDGDTATIFGPLVSYGPLKFPSFSVRDGGRWRAIIERFEVDPPLDDAQFDSRALSIR